MLRGYLTKEPKTKAMPKRGRFPELHDGAKALAKMDLKMHEILAQNQIFYSWTNRSDMIANSAKGYIKC